MSNEKGRLSNSKKTICLLNLTASRISSRLLRTHARTAKFSWADTSARTGVQDRVGRAPPRPREHILGEQKDKDLGRVNTSVEEVAKITLW